MAALEPELCILDETDSGLDIDALKTVANGVNSLRSPDRSFIIVTHYQRILDYVKPDFVHVLYQGKIIKSGDFSLAKNWRSKVMAGLLTNSERAGKRAQVAALNEQAMARFATLFEQRSGAKSHHAAAHWEKAKQVGLPVFVMKIGTIRRCIRY